MLWVSGQWDSGGEVWVVWWDVCGACWSGWVGGYGVRVVWFEGWLCNGPEGCEWSVGFYVLSGAGWARMAEVSGVVGSRVGSTYCGSAIECGWCERIRWVGSGDHTAVVRVPF